MTPEQLEEARVKYEAMEPHDLRDSLGEAIRRVIQSERGRVSVQFSFVYDDGYRILAQEYFVENELEKSLLFRFLRLVRGELEGMDYKFSYKVVTNHEPATN